MTNHDAPARTLHAVCFLALAAGCTLPARAADPTPTPAPSASPTATPAPDPTATPRRLGLHVSGISSLTFIDQSTNGRGQIAPEAPGFIAGLPLAPNTPYDVFSSAPQVPGVAGIGIITPTIALGLRSLDLSLTVAAATTNGSRTNVAYWGENLMPTLNPHLGSQAQPYSVTFPTHAGEDAATATRTSILAGSIATADGTIRLRAGWFDLAQTDRFVFAPAALTNLNPALAYAPAESLTGGLAGSDTWQPAATALPLHGLDLTVKRGLSTFELTNAALPSLPGDDARMTQASLVVDRGEGTRFSAQVLHVQTSGTPFITTVPFGTDPTFVPYPQGVLPTSMLSGQRQTVAGVRGAFHLASALGLDGIAELGRAWYDASPAAHPGTARPGGFYHAGLIRTSGRTTAALDWYRMEPRYATMILPYGVPENQWSVAFAWPGQWLKSNYQLIDNSVLGVNRQGFRLRYNVDRGPFEIHLEYTDLRQIEAETIVSSTQTGFIDGFYLPQALGTGTFGHQKRSAVWIAWHPRVGDFTLDLVDDTLYRPFVATHPEDVVSYDVPQGVLTYAKHVTPAVTIAAGIGRYAIKGAFAQPLDLAERLTFAGIQARQSANASVLVSMRHTTFDGRTTYPQSPLVPAFAGTSLVIEQRVSF
jgi:hypothetical protein